MKWMSVLSAMLVAGSAHAVTVNVVNFTDTELKAFLLLSDAQSGALVDRVDDQLLQQGQVLSQKMGQDNSAERFMLRFELSAHNGLPVCQGALPVSSKDNVQLVVEGHPGAAPANCIVSK